MPQISVVISTHNPHPERLRAALRALAAQTLAQEAWELLIVDNASGQAVDLAVSQANTSLPTTILREPKLGLTSARLAGIAAARAPLLVFVDDDNVLAPDYLERTAEVFAHYPTLGAAGGRIVPSFESQPAPWVREFLPLLAVRDLGSEPLLSSCTAAERVIHYPEFAPVGAGMALRKECAVVYAQTIAEHPNRLAFDRRGRALSSGGDNDIVLTLLSHGWQVGYFPQLSLTHLIPAGRLDCHYLARLQRDLARTWVLVLAEHGIRPWSPIAGASVPLRKLRAWFHHHAWLGRERHVRWCGACGIFEGRSLLS